LNRKLFIGQRMNEFSIGHWVITKVYWIVNMAILLKVYGLEGWAPIILPGLLFMVWLIGIFVWRTGLWDRYIGENLRAIK